MADYVNKNCPRCGGYVRLLTVGEVCEKCGYNLRSVDYSDTCSTSADENKTCPICKKALKKQLDGSFTCDGCGYYEKLSTYIPETDLQIKKILSERKTAAISTDNDYQVGGLYGWICPKCGAVMSPFTSFCPNCTQRNWEVTCATGTNSTKSNFDVNQFIGGRKDKLGYE